MSATVDALFTQRFLACAGLYTDTLDGRWGRHTQDAQDQFDKMFADLARFMGTFDPRTEANIHSLLPKAQIAARKFLLLDPKDQFVIKILSGTRTYAEQNALFAQTNPRVTKASAGHSNHNFGISWDIGIFVGGEYYDGSDRDPARARAEEQAYINQRNVTKAQIPEIEWGGDWTSIVDRPHYQLRTGKSVDQVRALFEAGKSFV